MPLSRIRFVTACQQLLALGVVLAVLAPATNVISLDVVQDRRAQVGIVPEGQAPKPTVDPSPRSAAAEDLDRDGRNDQMTRVRLPGSWPGYATIIGLGVPAWLDGR